MSDNTKKTGSASGNRGKKVSLMDRETSRSLSALPPNTTIVKPKDPIDTLNNSNHIDHKVAHYLKKAHALYSKGEYAGALRLCDECYELDAIRSGD